MSHDFEPTEAEKEMLSHIKEIEEKHPWWKNLEKALSKKDEYHFCKVDATDLKFALVHYHGFHQELQKARERYENILTPLLETMSDPRAGGTWNELAKEIQSELDQPTKLQNCIECGYPVPEYEEVSNCHGTCRLEV